MTASAVDVEDLFTAVDDDPEAVIVRASAILTGTDGRAAIVARWARGMAFRQLNDLASGEGDLRTAHAEALALGDLRLAARVDVTLALVILNTATADAALAVLDAAARHLDGTDLARLDAQRGLVYHRIGRLDRAQREYERALARFAGGSDPIGEVRLLNNQAILFAQRGRLDRSERAASQALALAERHGQRYMAAGALQNRGYVRGRAGRADDALVDLERAEATYQDLGRPDLVHVAQVDLAEVLLRANLLGEALDVAVRAVAGLRGAGNPTELADAWLLLARCQLATGQMPASMVSARNSAHLLRRQGRTSLLDSATFIRVFASSGRRGEMRPEDLEDLSARLRANGWWLESTVTRVLAVDKWVRAGDIDRAERSLASFERLGSLPAAERSAVAVARATVAQARGDLARTRRAVTEGLRIVADNQSSFADLESRTMAAGHGAVLRDLGARLAIDARRPRELLRRLEATRAGVVTAPRPSLGNDPLSDLLDELRDVAGDARATSAAGRGDDGLRLRQLDLERRIRARARRLGGDTDQAGDLGDGLAALGTRMLLEFAVLGDRLWAVSVAGRTAELHDLGRTDELGDDLDACSFSLHRLNRTGSSPTSRDAAWATLGEIGASLAAQLLPARVCSSSSPLVIVADGVLHGVPWRTVVPDGRVVSVAPSLLSWAAAATRSRVGRRRSVAVLSGPGLAGATAEVGRIAASHPASTTVVTQHATCADLLRAFGSADLLHLACHGHFRIDNPMFSTLSMADGDVNVYDLQRCARLPRTVVLSACSVGSSIGLRGGTLLGLATALMSFGVTNVIAPLTPVNDEAVVEVMEGLHRGLAAGHEPAAALAAIRAEPGSTAAAAVAAFIALGA